jgi:7-keto-8-aminopelargonate synthetase-like enzyme
MNLLPPPLQQIDRKYVSYRGERFSYFGGCDYFRLASHPNVLRAARDGLATFGLNVSASRVTTGNHRLYDRLETELARFFDVEAALLVSNGYITNLAVAQTLAGRFSHAMLDAHAHPSLADAALLLDCPIVKFRHRDAEDLGRVLRRLGPDVRPILLTEGMFSCDGSVAPLKAYLTILPKDALVLLDDAHGAGVLGKTGRGTAEYAGASRRRIIQTVTLSKAFGAYGGAILATRRLREQIIARSRIFTGSTPLPLPLASAALEAVGILRNGSRLRARLQRNAHRLKTALYRAGISEQPTPGPVVSVIPRHNHEAQLLERSLLRRKIFPAFIQYPGGPAGGYFRFAISSEHTRGQLDQLMRALTEGSVAGTKQENQAPGRVPFAGRDANAGKQINRLRQQVLLQSDP